MADRLIRFQAPQLPAVEDVSAYFTRSVTARWYSNGGPCHQLLVERLEALLHGLRCMPVANATLGLMVALRALSCDGRGVRREVLMPSFTFAAVVNAVLWAGLDPVFVDVEPESWHLDSESLERAISARSPRVAAVLACSTFGVPPPAHQRHAWEVITRDAEVPLIVDSAPGFGATADDGQVLGRQGDAEVFSFHATKPFAVGEGGLVTTDDEDLAERIARLVNFGFDGGVIAADIGLNAKLAEWPAATALAVLDTYDEVVRRRRAIARRMTDGLWDHGYRTQAGVEGAVWQFVPVLAPSVATRAAAMGLAARQGIELRSYFAIPLHKMTAFASVSIAGHLRCTEDLAGRVLSLPMANDLAPNDVEAIVGCLAAASAAGGASRVQGVGRRS